MRNNLTKIALAAGFWLAMAFTFSCSSESSGGGSTDITIDKRVVGSWINADGSTCVFNADGTGKDKNGNFKYVFFSNKIVIASERYSSYSGHSVSTGVADYVFSTDGKTLIVYNSLGAEWFTKSNDSKQ